MIYQDIFFRFFWGEDWETYLHDLKQESPAMPACLGHVKFKDEHGSLGAFFLF